MKFIDMKEMLTPKKTVILMLVSFAAYLLLFATQKAMKHNSTVREDAIHFRAIAATGQTERKTLEQNISCKRDKNVHAEKWIVVTSIQHPTKTVKDLASIPGWQLVVVGDTKTPPDWKLNGVIYLGIERQKSLCFQTVRYLPYKSYTRKLIGYLYAVQHGAKYIYDTDDDNVPWDNLSTFHIGNTADVLTVDTNKLVFNPYSHFGQASIWPRGFPVDYFTSTSNFHDYKLSKISTPVVQQGLIDGDPDVDAYYRMTRKHHQEKLHIKFDPVGPPVALPYNTFAPYNSQNTLITYDGFWSLMLPVSTTFRTCDIYRGYWSQPLMRLIGKQLAFYPPNSVHYRNAHSYIDDAKDEIDFLRMGYLLAALKEWSCKKPDFRDCIRDLTKMFVDMKHYAQAELDLLNAWLEDLNVLNYKFPAKVTATSELVQAIDFKYFSKEMPASMPHRREYYISQEGGGKLQVPKFLQKRCPQKTVPDQLISLQSHNDEYSDVLLVIYQTSNDYVFAMHESYYHLKHLFLRRVYCARRGSAITKSYEAWEVSVIFLEDGKDSESDCLATAMKLGYITRGYLFIHEASTFVQHDVLSNFNFKSTWSMLSVAKERLHKCITSVEPTFACSNFGSNPSQVSSLAQTLKGSESFDKCLQDEKQLLSTVSKKIILIPKEYKAIFLETYDIYHFSVISKLCLKHSSISKLSDITINISAEGICDLI